MLFLLSFVRFLSFFHSWSFFFRVFGFFLPCFLSPPPPPPAPFKIFFILFRHHLSLLGLRYPYWLTGRRTRVTYPLLCVSVSLCLSLSVCLSLSMSRCLCLSVSLSHRFFQVTQFSWREAKIQELTFFPSLLVHVLRVQGLVVLVSSVN